MNIDANGLSLYVEVHGDGPPVLLLHGFPDSGRLWRHQVPALVAACHRVIVPDLRGFGRSARPSEVDAYPMPVILGGIDRLLTALEVDVLPLSATTGGPAGATSASRTPATGSRWRRPAPSTGCRWNSSAPPP